MAWPLAPLASAASSTGAFTDEPPSTVEPGLPPPALTYSRTILLPSSVEPARTTPKPSMRHRLPCCTTSSGNRSIFAETMKLTTSWVTPLVGAFLAAPAPAFDAPAGLCPAASAFSPTHAIDPTVVAAAFRKSLRVKDMVTLFRDECDSRRRPPGGQYLRMCRRW